MFQEKFVWRRKSLLGGSEVFRHQEDPWLMYFGIKTKSINRNKFDEQQPCSHCLNLSNVFVFYDELRRTRRDVLEQIVEEELREDETPAKLNMPDMDFPGSDDDDAAKGTFTAIRLETTTFLFVKVDPTPHYSILWPFS